MRVELLAVALILSLPGAAAAQRIQLGAGATFTQLSEMAEGYDGSSGGIGWTLGGSLRFGKTLTVAPGLYWQQVRVDLKDRQANQSDGVGLTGFQVPVMVGIGIDLKVVGLDIYAGPSVTFLTKVGGNDAGLEKSDVKRTAFGGQVGAIVDLLSLSLAASHEFPFTDLFDSPTPYGKGKLGVTRLGLAFRF